MAKFVYNNAKNVDIGNMLYELNFSYYLDISFMKTADSYFPSKTADELLLKL